MRGITEVVRYVESHVPPIHKVDVLCYASEASYADLTNSLTSYRSRHTLAYSRVGCSDDDIGMAFVTICGMHSYHKSALSAPIFWEC